MKKIKIGILTGIILISTLFLFIQPIKADYRTEHVYEICLVDTMIQRVNNPEVLNWLSYPEISKLQVGCHYLYFPDFCWESYFHFSYNERPDDLVKAEIRIYIYETCCADKNFSICVYLSDWTVFSNYTHIVYGGVERHLWLSLPNKTDFVAKVDTYFSGSPSYIQFDITKYIYRDNLSIVLTPSIDEITPENHVYLCSTDRISFKPRIIWTYQEYYEPEPEPEPEPELIPKTDVIPYIIMFTLIGVIIGSTLFYFGIKFRRLRRGET